jgi:hypothetical protein
LPKTNEETASTQSKKKEVHTINDSVCDVTQELDDSSDEDEKVGVVVANEEEEDVEDQ